MALPLRHATLNSNPAGAPPTLGQRTLHTNNTIFPRHGQCSQWWRFALPLGSGAGAVKARSQQRFNNADDALMARQKFQCLLEDSKPVVFLEEGQHLQPHGRGT